MSPVVLINSWLLGVFDIPCKIETFSYINVVYKRAKNRAYLYGRIQVSLDRKWMGRKAKIIVRIPVHSRGLDVKHS